MNTRYFELLKLTPEFHFILHDIGVLKEYQIIIICQSRKLNLVELLIISRCYSFAAT